MKMKKIIPMVMMATLPTVGMAQDGSGLFEKNFDHSVKPQDDFYQFATGGWQKNNPLPTAVSAASTSCKRTTTSVLTQFFRSCRKESLRQGQ